MSTATTSKNPPESAPADPAGPGVSFLRVLKSEWIKVTTVPSTVILLAVTVLVMVGLAAGAAWGTAQLATDAADRATQSAPPVDTPAEAAPSAVPTEGAAAEAAPTAVPTEVPTDVPTDGAPAGDPAGGPPAAGSLVPEVPSSGVLFGQLLIASLAVVLIASEWGTGMIRSTFSAVPKRTPALLAKNLIIAVISFVVGAGAAFISFLVARPILNSADLSLSLSDDGVLASILNTGTFLALLAVFSMGIGTLLRNTAGGVVTAIGVIFVLPLVATILQNLGEWITDAARFLPSNAGAQLVMAGTTAEGDLTQLQGGLVLAAWAAVLLITSIVVTKKRDV